MPRASINLEDWRYFAQQDKYVWIMETLLSCLSNGGTIRRLYTQGNDLLTLIGAAEAEQGSALYCTFEPSASHWAFRFTLSLQIHTEPSDSHWAFGFTLSLRIHTVQLRLYELANRNRNVIIFATSRTSRTVNFISFREEDEVDYDDPMPYTTPPPTLTWKMENYIMALNSTATLAR